MAAESAIPDSGPTPPAAASTTRDELREILEIALRGGQLLLENGAETWRIEETVERLGVGLGAEWMEIYPTPTGIIMSALAGGEHRTRIRRVTSLGVDLSRVGAVLDLSRRAYTGQLTRNAARAEMEGIASMPRAYPAWLTVVVLSIACGSLGAFFGGGWREFGLGVLAAAVTVLARNWLNRFFGRPILATVTLSAAVGTAAAVLGVRLVPCRMPELVVIASIVSLVPGVPMMLSIADLINANYVSGLARGAQALLYVAALAIGMAFSLALFRGPAFP